MFRKMGDAVQIFDSGIGAQLDESAGPWRISHQQETIRSVDEVMFWPVLLARIFGYWPFLRLDGKYAFKWSGAGFWLTISNFLMLIASLGMVGAHGESMFVPVGVELSHSSTESASLWSIVLMESIAVLLLLALTLANRQELLSTWETVSDAVNDVCGNDNQNAAICMSLNLASSARRKINIALAVLLTFSVVRATVRLAEVAHSTFYRLVFWKACLCVTALFAWDLMYSMTNLWILIVTGFISCLTMSCQMLRSQFRNSNGVIYAIGRHSQNHMTLSHLENLVRLHRELCRTAEVMNAKLKVPVVAIFMLKIVVLTLAIFFAVTGMDLSNGLLEYDAVGQLLTIIIDLLSFHYLCSSGTAFTLEAKRFSDTLENAFLRLPAVEITANIKYECIRMIANPPVISPGHFFTVRNRLMSTIISVLTSYSIVLIQFDNAEDAESRHCPMVNETKH